MSVQEINSAVSSDLILASASPRRSDLLDSTGISFRVVPADVQEQSETANGQKPEDLAVENARLKARAILDDHPAAIVIGADTIVVRDNHILGKPADEAQARNTLQSLQGRNHQVITGVSICSQGKETSWAERTEVTFRSLTPQEIETYVATGEPMDKAGAYGIQGRAAQFVTRITGSYTNVVGLPLAQLIERLEQHGR